MDERVKVFLESKNGIFPKDKNANNKIIDKEKFRKQKEKDLIQWGFFDKIYSPDNSFSIDYNYFDGERYYKAVPAEVSDEEYEELLNYREELEQEYAIRCGKSGATNKSKVANKKVEYKFSVPKSLEDITKMDTYTQAVMKTANKIGVIGIVLSVIVMLIGVIFAMEASFESCLPFLGISLIILIIFDVIAKIIGGISVIMYNTKISAAAALYNIKHKG